MKFVVTKGYAGEVDVKLHWETKDKITKAAWIAGTAAAGVMAWYIYTK